MHRFLNSGKSLPSLGGKFKKAVSFALLTGICCSPSKTLCEGREVTVEYKKIVKITVFTETFCKECRDLVQFFKDNQVTFDERDFWTFSGFVDRTFRGYSPPVTVIDYSDGTSRKIIGFDRKILSALIDPKSPPKKAAFDVRENFDRSKDSFDFRPGGDLKQ